MGDESVAAFVEYGQKKADKATLLTAAQGFMAGFWLSIFGHGALSLGGTMYAESHSFGKLFYAISFPIGLMAILFSQAELFTSNTAVMAMYVLDGKKKEKGKRLLSLLKNWSISLFMNLIGSLFVALCISFPSKLLDHGGPYDLLEAAVHKKLGLSWLQSVPMAIGCNVIVVFTVYVAYRCKAILEKTVVVWVFISAFVWSGFEHIIANFFTLPMGLLVGIEGTIGRMLLHNWLPVLVGNVIGGVALACILYYQNLVQEPKIKDLSEIEIKLPGTCPSPNSRLQEFQLPKRPRSGTEDTRSPDDVIPEIDESQFNSEEEGEIA
eukprot:GHVP01005516.1.p1 GENE.GHVP01005516.1~~GHVP01005516.1.p1  ORF type:complete len:323 (+),score=59.55 GHVP01005516.1:97-1065(+)